jgi:hypothetical protein
MGHPPISKIAKGFRLHPSVRNEANNIDSLSQMQAKKIKKNHVWLFWFFVAELLQPPGGGKVKSAIARPGQPTKKKPPPGTMPRGFLVQNPSTTLFLHLTVV